MTFYTAALAILQVNQTNYIVVQVQLHLFQDVWHNLSVEIFSFLFKFQDLHKATTFVKDAKAGRNFKFKLDKVSLDFYDTYNRWYFVYLLYFFLFVIMALALFEDPAITNLELPIWVSIIAGHVRYISA